ncbi:Flp pilus assembly complex ATPase component TadA [Paenalkalicoccus suaedae]|uniref:Flp pilus assembly complex ATPase component TadA n=1 Tax=Paenalkalicoccus suaedae TaxID=2592382 RepID=A0A859FFB7_9BACI|nr:GspE/PulE family protein [Paenalkalicoccus suaedae]QKS71859.1 Flp pilus assembly complex ATPase component TadA [Paenalkalicoccus suaedae]
MAQARKRLGDLLVEAGLLTKEQVESVVASKGKLKLGDALIERGLITEQQVIEVLEFQLGIPHIKLNRFPIDPQLTTLIPKEMAERMIVFPLERKGGQLRVAMEDPMDYVALDDLRMTTGFEIAPAISGRKEILEAIYQYYQPLQGEDVEVEEVEEVDSVATTLTDDEQDAPIIRIVNQLLVGGLRKSASDIHLDPHEKRVLVRYRIDGMMRTEKALAKQNQNAIVARIKIMANLNITETRLPQDGRVKVIIDTKQVDLRISTMPTIFGEKIVVRILDTDQSTKTIEQLDFNPVNEEAFRKLLKKQAGMILVAGPTGSGKTTTLYSALHQLNTDDVNLITIEDPVEYQIEGINQVQVNPRIGLTFASGLRTILRQDPNIVMVGEIRDGETAQIAIRASLTGHLVFSTIHTNSAVGTIPRLIDMGIEPFLVTSSLAGIVSQRLIRKVCESCKEEYQPTVVEKKLFEDRGLEVDTLIRGAGCQACNHSGYKGRMAIHELLVVDDEVRKMVLNNESVSSIRHYLLTNDMLFLLDDGLFKAKQHHTSIDEVYRVAGDD